jgi:hypothetical protein
MRCCPADVTCYQQADEDSMMKVMASPVKLVGRKGSRTG